MSAVEPLADSYLDLWRHFDPAAASEAGPGEADARLGDFTAESVRRHAAAFRSLASALEALAVERLGDEIDRTVLLDRIRAILDRLEHDRPHLRDPGFWLDHLIRALAALLARPREETGARAYAAARRIEGIPGFLDQARATLRRPPAILVDYALTLLGPLGELLVRAAAEFGREAPGGPEALNPRVAAALEALTRFGGALREMESDPNQGAVGERRLERLLHQRDAVRAGVAELARYAARMQEEIEAELARRARALAPGRSWRDLATEIEGTPARDPVGYARSEIERARRLLEERTAVSLPGDPVEVVETPGHLRFLVPEAGFGPVAIRPGTARLFVTPGALSEPALSLAVAREVFPGRYLQLRAAAAAPSRVRRELCSEVALEGWALYAGDWAAELGFYRDPAADLLRLVRLLRAAVGLALDLGLHARGLSLIQGVELLTSRLPLDRGRAEVEVRRAAARPGSALAPAVGRREILRLRDRYAAAGAGAPGDFHARLLGAGVLPPEVVGWEMGAVAGAR